MLSRGSEGTLPQTEASRGIIGWGSTETPTNSLGESRRTRNFHGHSYRRWGIVPSTQPKVMFRLQPESFGRLDPTHSFIMFGEAPITVTHVKMNIAFGIAARDTGQQKIEWSANEVPMQL